MSLSRRELLASMGGTAALALVGGTYFLAQERGAPLLYCVPSAERNDLSLGAPKLQNFDWANGLATRTIPGVPQDFRTLLTLANPYRSSSQSVFTPGLIHSGSFLSSDQVLLVTRGEPSLAYALDTHSLEIVKSIFPPEGFVFGGHVIPFTEKGLFALTLNSKVAGQYDAVMVLDGTTWNEVHRLSSYGFQAHDLALSSDHKRILVGHYGSNFKSGPYRTLAASPLDIMRNPAMVYDPKTPFYPGSVASVNISDGRLADRKTHSQNGPQGHFAVNSHEQIFLTKIPPLLKSEADAVNSKTFQEGNENKNQFSDFLASSKISGTTVVVDEKFSQFILPDALSRRVIYGNFDKPEEISGIEFAKNYGQYGEAHGIAFHPDGVHYIVSCEKGFVAFTRGSHQHSARHSFLARVASHSHFCMG